jgi:hypothetical protein
MSQQPISLSPDLKHLRDDGFDVEVKYGHLLIKNVPYVNSNREIKLGTLVSELTMAGDLTTTPNTHVALFVGEHPCNIDGSEIAQIKHQSVKTVIGNDLEINHSFSSKPTSGSYKDYYEKITTYIAIISSPAQAIDSNVTAKTYPVIEPVDGESVFRYFDTASSRAGINIVTKKLEIGKIGIVGVGGTGSYVLDLVAKTPVREIHLFDGDKLLNHNAFRCPGAPSVGELRNQPQKVTYFKERYSQMHLNIFAHDCFIDESNVNQLEGLDFVFLCMDVSESKLLIVEKLEEQNIPFIDVGLGVELDNESLGGILRVTTSTVDNREYVRKNNRISFSNGNGNDDYSRNIQIADLNALNAALAVIKWKKLFGFYRDLEKENFCAYTIDGNSLINDDQV